MSDFTYLVVTKLSLLTAMANLVSLGALPGVSLHHGTVNAVPAKEHCDAPAPNAAGSIEAAPNFEAFIHSVWGSGVAKHFAIPYNQKLWTVPLSEMETSWLGGRVPLPNLEEMIDGALQPVAKPVGPNARFGYPLQGGFQAAIFQRQPCRR